MGHAFGIGRHFSDPFKGFGLDRGRGNPMPTFHINTMHGDRRRTGTSVTDGHDHGIALLFDLLE